jgi:hypothetical protein
MRHAGTYLEYMSTILPRLEASSQILFPLPLALSNRNKIHRCLKQNVPYSNKVLSARLAKFLKEGIRILS